MDRELAQIRGRDLARAGLPALPKLIVQSGDRASWRFLEFFTANIRNKNTRAAYAHAVGQFFDWADKRGIRDIREFNPVLIAGYVENHPGAAPTVKQHLAAIRMLFDWLVIGQIVPMNPANSVRGPRHVVKRGKTPVLRAEEARLLLDSINTESVIGLRDRAIIATMVFSFARISAVVGLKLEDYYQNGKRWWIRLHEKGGKRHEVPSHHALEAYLDAYISAAGIGEEKKGPLFRTAN